MRRLTSLYATVDLRAVAAGRIALALVLLLDLVKRLPGLLTWYTNEGLLPNHTVLWKPTFDPTFSPFYMASHGWQAGLGFAVCGLAYLALLLGWRTKAAQVVSLVAVLGLHGRVLFLQNGGDVVLSLLALWTVFLPTGERYSVDAWLRFERRREDAPIASGRNVISLGFTALLLQLAVIYAFNCVHKTGPSWRDGSAVHYTLHQDRMVTSFGVWFRDWMPGSVGQWLTWSALFIEALLPLLLLSPFGQRWSRRGAAVLIVALHAGVALVFPVDVNRADREMLLRVPGVGVRAADRVLAVRRSHAVTLRDLARLRVALGRARPFIITADHNPALAWLDGELLAQRLRPPKQLSLFDAAAGARTGEL